MHYHQAKTVTIKPELQILMADILNVTDNTNDRSVSFEKRKGKHYTAFYMEGDKG